MTTPLLQAIKHKHPTSSISFMAYQKYSELISLMPGVTTFIPYLNFWQALLEIKKTKPNIIIDLHKKPITYLLSILSGCKKRFGYQKALLPRILLRIKWRKISINPTPLRYFSDVSKLGILPDNFSYLLFPPNQWEDILKKFNLNNISYYVFYLGATHFTKRIPPQKAISLIKRVNIPAVLLGGSDVIENARIIKKEIPSVIDLTGQTSLTESISIIYGSKCFVGGDSGLSHIAVALNKPTLIVFGSTIPEYGMIPIKRDAALIIEEVKNLTCRPCTLIGRKKCPLSHFNCMNLINDNNIVNFIKSNL